MLPFNQLVWHLSHYELCQFIDGCHKSGDYGQMFEAATLAYNSRFL